MLTRSSERIFTCTVKKPCPYTFVGTPFVPLQLRHLYSCSYATCTQLRHAVSQTNKNKQKFNLIQQIDLKYVHSNIYMLKS